MGRLSTTECTYLHTYLAINNVADMATDKFASVSARVQDFEDSLVEKLGSPENDRPRLGDLDPDI